MSGTGDCYVKQAKHEKASTAHIQSCVEYKIVDPIEEYIGSYQRLGRRKCGKELEKV